MTEILRLADLEDPGCNRTVEVLEAGGVVVLTRGPFALTTGERRFLKTGVGDARRKNVSFDPATGALSGGEAAGEDRVALAAMVRRYADAAQALLEVLTPRYAPALQRKRTSFRPEPIEHRALSPRKDDKRLHIDAFPANPVQGRRILRVFANVNDAGEDRLWNVGGDGFGAFAAAFRERVRPRAEGWRAPLGLTKGERSAYDSAMLQLHDRAKLDDAWQAQAEKLPLSLPPGAMWIVFTDAVLHAALSGRHALEQTFLLDPAVMAAPGKAPVRILEDLYARPLV